MPKAERLTPQSQSIYDQRGYTDDGKVFISVLASIMGGLVANPENKNLNLDQLSKVAWAYANALLAPITPP